MHYSESHFSFSLCFWSVKYGNHLLTSTSFSRLLPSGDSSCTYVPVKYRCTKADFPLDRFPTIPYEVKEKVLWLLQIIAWNVKGNACFIWKVSVRLSSQMCFKCYNCRNLRGYGFSMTVKMINQRLTFQVKLVWDQMNLRWRDCSTKMNVTFQSISKNFDYETVKTDTHIVYFVLQAHSISTILHTAFINVKNVQALPPKSGFIFLYIFYNITHCYTASSVWSHLFYRKCL